jgi:hypothetical protein
MGGPAPIAISEVWAYANYRRLDNEDDIDRLLYLIAEIDIEWLDRVNTKD